jgi:hypothetical protein
MAAGGMAWLFLLYVLRTHLRAHIYIFFGRCAGLSVGSQRRTLLRNGFTASCTTKYQHLSENKVDLAKADGLGSREVGDMDGSQG